MKSIQAQFSLLLNLERMNGAYNELFNAMVPFIKVSNTQYHLNY